MAYQGPDRRIHKVYVTRNTEYHTKANVCIAVRDRGSGEFLDRHIALRKPLCGSIRFDRGSVMPNSGTPRLGDSLYFHDRVLDVVTSTLEAVERPPKSVVQAYAF